MADFDKVKVDPADLVDGYTAEDLFQSAECMGITFDDLITLPGMIDFGVHEVDLSTRITRNHKLTSPLVSSPMDTVTEEAMAIAMALNGGIGFIHTHCSIEEQAAMVRKVKTYENGFILEPALLSPDDKISKLDELRKTRKISGVPLTVDGKLGSRLVGLISNRDTDFVVDRDQPIRDFMTPLEGLVTGTYPISIAEANDILKTSKKGYLPIVDGRGNLVALTTRTDLKKNKAFPNATKDATGKLLVGAAIKARTSDDFDMERVHALRAAGCDILALDSQNGDSSMQVDFIRMIKAECPGMDVIAGNVVRASQAKHLLDAGADGLRIGMGVGSIATSQVVKAVGRPQLSSIYAVSRIARCYDVPVIADGGLKNTGCVIKALAIGADAVMMGSLLAGVDEAPGDYFFQDGMRLKKYRGTFSAALQGGSGAGDSAIPLSGVQGSVVDKGPLSKYFPFLCQSIRHGLQDMGTNSLAQTREYLENGQLRFELRSTSAQREGGVHDLHSFQQRLYA